MPKRHLPRRRTLLQATVLAGSAVLLVACASAPPPLRPAMTASDAADDTSVYGLYLAGEAALDRGESGEAAFYLGRASARSPQVGFIRERAFAAALEAGEIDRAAALAPSAPPPAASGLLAADAVTQQGRPGQEAEETPGQAAFALGVLARATVELADDHGKAADALLSSAPQGEHASAIVLLRPWAAAAAGDWKRATAPVPAVSDRAVASFAELGRARLLEHAGRMAEAEGAFKDQTARGGIFALAYGEFLERRGRRADAVAIYGAALAKEPTDPVFLAAKARASSRAAPPPLPTVKEGAAQAMIGPAALLLAVKQSDAGMAYLRLALKLDPRLDEGWVLLGDALDADGDDTAARDAYGHVRPDSPEYSTAEGRLALNLQTAGDKAAALKLAQATAAANPHDAQALLVLADVLRDDDRYDEAVAVLDRLIAETGGDSAANWRLYFLRGASLERAGRWDRAQGDLEQALKLRPDDPEVLNYLGFAWADRGEHLDRALALLQKATILDPKDGAIVDSLGWVHYRLGDYPQAVRELELAVSLDPADPEVNNHLGDAYWRAGRRLEAAYQWSRVLTLDPDTAMKADAEGKLAGGLKLDRPPGALPSGPAPSAKPGPGAAAGSSAQAPRTD